MKRICKTHIHQRGFTMIEMVLVLIVMAIIATFILARATPGSNDLIAQAEILKSHLRYAQIRAMNDTVPWGITFTNSTTYTLFKTGVTSPPSNLPGDTSYTHTLTGISMTTDFGSNIYFNEWGTPVDAGGAAIATATPQTITLTQGTATSPITITKNTGYIP